VLLPATAVLVTPPMAVEIDAPVQRYFQRENPLGKTFAKTMLVSGYFVPIVVPLGIYLGGLSTDRAELATAGSAALQAIFVESVMVSALKWITDRSGPYADGDPARSKSGLGYLHNTNDPMDFDFNATSLDGALRWPSGHTAIHMAVVSSLFAFYRDEPLIALLGYPIVLAVGMGMVEGDYHWLSDVVAGALIGHAIGWQIGSHFRERFDRASNAGEGTSTREPSQALWIPCASPQMLGMMVLSPWG
jgi:membrane-associated phospholipid phosphatase